MKDIFKPGLSLAKKLTLLFCTLLLTGTVIFAIISYIGVRKASRKVGEERLRILTGQLSSMFGSSTHNFSQSLLKSAEDASIKTFIITGGKDSLNPTKNKLLNLIKDSLDVEASIMNLDGNIILNESKDKANLNQFTSSIFKDARILSGDSARVERLYSINGKVYYPVIAIISSNKNKIGYLIRWRILYNSPEALKRLSYLMGTGATIYIGNSNGNLWSNLMKPVAQPFPSKDSLQLQEYSRLGQGPFIGTIRTIPGTQWLLAVEFPEKNIMEAATGYVYWILITSLVLLIIGIITAWMLARSITRPLKKLNDAAKQIASGNYSSVIQLDRNDELGELAGSFNYMSSEIKIFREELEKKAETFHLLFESNPLPMWLLSKDTLEVLDVNEAAMKHYGYSKEEFLKLNSRNLRPQEDVKKYMDAVAHLSIKGEPTRGIWRHKKKDGTVIMVDIMENDILYDGKSARLVLANDITEKLKAEAELVRHRVMEQKLISEITIQAREKEREELGKELHDNINQILASTKLYLEMAKSGNTDLLPKAINKSHENINLAISEIRKLSKQLVTPSLNTSLIDAVSDLCSEIKAIAPINIQLTYNGLEETKLNDPMKLTLYRIVQEQTNNILKYAAASEVAINFEIKHNTLHLTIMDNGVGFDPLKKNKGIGLKNIEARVSFHEGVTKVISEPGNGCILYVTFPLENPNKSQIRA